MLFRQVYDRKLSQYAYLIGCEATGEALIVDPMRDVDRYHELAAAEHLKLVGAAETHIHADYLSGLRELADRGLKVFASREGGADWQYEWLRNGDYASQLVGDGDTFSVGNIRFTVMHTPGHTPEHVCFLVTDMGGGADRPMGILTGDFVFVGDVGRPDLLESAAGHAGAMEPSARSLYQSVLRFCELPDYLQVWPAHGAGSACGKALGAVPSSTVGYEKSFNASIKAATSESAFVSWILDGQPEPPLYFGRMKVQNRQGPRVLGALPAPRQLRAQKLNELSGATGVAVIDTRQWQPYRDGHLPGSLWAPIDQGTFNTIAGCYIPDEMPIYVIIDQARVQEAVVDLVHVGLDNIVGWIAPEALSDFTGAGGKLSRIPEVDAGALEEKLGREQPFLLDVRRVAEVQGSGMIGEAHNIAHTRLAQRLSDIPRDQPIVVYCQGGTRSAAACGYLDRMGYRVTNLAGGFARWKQHGGPVSSSTT